MRVLILMDNATLPLLKNGTPPVSGFSHDKNLFQFAHESLRKGYDVFIASVQDAPLSRPYHQIRSVYPLWDQSADVINYADIAPDIIIGVFMEAMNIRGDFPGAKLVAIQAAVHWIESPDNFNAHYLFDTITAARYNVDFIITQNSRMKNILDIFYRFIAQTRISDRILVCPLGIVEEERREAVDREATRREMGLAPNEVAIINSGGVWNWTDFDTFLSAFCEDARINGGGIKLYIMGLQQPQNQEHKDYIDRVRRIIDDNRHLLGRQIILEEDWYAASRNVRRYTASADVGLNVNKGSLENWQSYRLRFLDYMYFGLPAINTLGDEIVDTFGTEALFPVVSGDRQSYLDALQAIRTDPAAIRRKSAAMTVMAKRFDSQNTYGKAIDQIVATPRRPVDDHAAWPANVLDYTSDRAHSAAINGVMSKLRGLLS